MTNVSENGLQVSDVFVVLTTNGKVVPQHISGTSNFTCQWLIHLSRANGQVVFQVLLS